MIILLKWIQSNRKVTFEFHSAELFCFIVFWLLNAPTCSWIVSIEIIFWTISLQIDKHVLDKLCSSLQDYVDVESPEQVVTDEAEIQENNRLRAASVSLDTNF